MFGRHTRARCRRLSGFFGGTKYASAYGHWRSRTGSLLKCSVMNLDSQAGSATKGRVSVALYEKLPEQPL